MIFEKLKEEINKRTKDWGIPSHGESKIFLEIRNDYDEKLTFYSNGKVKSYGHCRFLLDDLGFYLRSPGVNDEFLDEIKYDGLIRHWDKEEKCGYWKVPE